MKSNIEKTSTPVSDTNNVILPPEQAALDGLRNQLAEEAAKHDIILAEVSEMQSRETEIARRIADIDENLLVAELSAKTASTEYAHGRGGEAAITKAQATVTSLTVSKAALDAAQLAITEELGNLEKCRKDQTEQIGTLQDRFWSAVMDIELLNADVYIKRAFAASRKLSFSGVSSIGNFERIISRMAYVPSANIETVTESLVAEYIQ